MKKLFCLLLALGLLLTLAACGGEEKDRDKDDGGKKGGIAQAKPYSGNYVYAPPTNNYHLVYSDGSEEARTGTKYTYFEADAAYCFHVDFTRDGVYVPYEGRWYNDTNYDIADYLDLETSAPLIFASMEEGLIGYLRAFGTEDDELGKKLEDYYVGQEIICGVQCWVFDSKGINALYSKYWVDPANGAVLKVEYYDSSITYTEELTVYDLDYTEMEQRLYPESYEDADIL